MPGTPADLVSRSLLVGRTSLYLTYTYENPLISRRLEIARVSLLGRITSRAYPLASRGLVLDRVPQTGRRTTSVNIHISRNLVIEKSVLGGVFTGGVVFPSLVPSSLQFTPPSHHTTRHATYSGEMEIHLWADTPTDAELRLEYANISDTLAESFCATWDKAYGITRRLQLPSRLLNGFDPELTAFVLETGTNTTWHFTEPPKWSHSVPGYGTLQVTLNSRFAIYSSAVGGNAPFVPSTPVSDSAASFDDCDYIGRMLIGFLGFIDPTTKFEFARFRDWDTPLFGVGTVDEGPGWRVDGSVSLQAIADDVGIVIAATGSFAYLLGTTMTMSSLRVIYSAVSTNTFAYAYGSPTQFPLELSDIPLLP